MIDNDPAWPWGTELPDWRTVKTVDAEGYRYNETSPAWKQACEVLPCFAGLEWPGYDTTIIERRIGGVPVVIQLWRGWCQQFLALADFPGGIGAEVGIYRRDPGHALPDRLPFLDDATERVVLNLVHSIAPDELWWPAPGLGTELRFEMVNPVTGEMLFATGPQRSYWLNKWMVEPDYRRYAARHGLHNLPLAPDHFVLRYRIDDEPWARWDGAELALYETEAFQTLRRTWQTISGWADQ